MKIVKFCAVFILYTAFFTSTIFGFESVSVSNLLISYLENDNDLKTNAINAKKAQLSYKGTQINNGFDITLSSGAINIKTDKDDTSVSVKPSVTAALPATSNLSVSASTDYSYSKTENKFKDTELNASIDIIGTTGLNRKIQLLKADRTVIEAERKLQTQAINSEKAFYTELKSLLNSTSNIINLEKTLYTNKIDFEKIKTQGYSTGSSTYRLAEMKVHSTQHDIDNSIRSLIHSYIVFYKKCGYDISSEENLDYMTLMPTEIAEVEPLDINSFNPDLYTETEAAIWTNKINTLQRKANSNFSLTANGGVTFNNSFNDSTTMDAGLSSTVGGITLGAEISMPVNDFSNPAYTLNAKIKPNTFRLNSLDKKTDELNEEQELLEIETARTNYETKVVDCLQNLEDLAWTKKSDSESYEMYSALEKDLSKWYADGFVNQSEYYSAKVNVQSYAVKQIINNIDYIIYNDNIITMFIGEN